MRTVFYLARLLLAPGLAMVLGACATTGGNSDVTNADPLEPFNRSMYEFNDTVDRAMIKPAAERYKRFVPARARKSVGNFFRNLGEPTTIVNDILQGKFPQAAHDFMRFVINTTFGVLGLFDIATEAGMQHHDEDFGQTFSVWGFGRGAYLVLPLLGPSTVTDGIGRIPEFYTDPVTSNGDDTATYSLLATRLIDTRAQLLSVSKVTKLQLDPYVFIRESYLQRRRKLIHDGEPPLEEAWE